MARARDVLVRLTVAGVATCAVLDRTAWAGPVAHPGAAVEVTATAKFTGEETCLPLDPARPVRAIPVVVPSASEGDRFVAVSSDDPGVLSVERGARVLPGQTIGYALVRALKPGEATLRAGESRIRIHVEASPGTGGGGAFGAAPELLAPRAGAGVWGKISISASCWREPGEQSDRTPALRLRVGEGSGARVFEPEWTTKPEEGPCVLASFTVDFTDQRPGACALRVVRTDAMGVEHASESAVVQVISPSPGAITEGECEADYGLMAQNVMGPPRAPAVSADKDASGGQFFNNAGADPRFRFPLTVGSEQGAGWYQVMITAGGDQACGALPSIGITVDEAQRPVTVSAIAQPAWHRIPVGTPIRLEPGFHAIRCDFVNDFYARGSDRNLRLDKIEIARVADGAGGKSMGGEGAMMSMAAQAPQGGGENMMAMSAMAGHSAQGAGWPASARSDIHPPVRVSFDRPLDGQPIAGEVELRGTVWWEDERNSPPPEVALLINGREVQRQRSDAPRFVVTPDSFVAGENSVQLRAITGTGGSATAVQRVMLPADLARGASEAARQSRRFTVYESGWSPDLKGSLKDNQGGDQRKSAPIGLSSQVTLELPDDLAGRFDVWLESRSNGRTERAVDMCLETGPKDEPVLPPQPVAGREVPSWYDAHRFTTDGSPLTLSPGPKRLVIIVPGPRGTWTPGKGDKNAVWVQGVRLVERPATPRQSKPVVTLEYPAESQDVFGADALVASLATDFAPDWAEPIVDGRATGLRFDLRRPYGGVGRILVPLSLRGFAAGEHRVALRIADMRGRTGDSAARTVRVPGEAPADGTVYDRAVMLLDRFAYGPDPRELAEGLRLGQRAYLEARLNAATGDDPADDAACELGAVRFPNPRSGYEVPRRAIQQAIATGNPVRNRFTLWAENHFSTWIRKDEAWRKWDEHERFSTLGVARFYDLLWASSTSPAMLRYLDQEQSYGGRLNENYAREIMELHTLGVHGGYKQADVTNLAHVLTGWTTARTALASVSEATPDDYELAEDFRFEPVLSENLAEHPRDVVGYRFAGSTKESRHERVLLALEILAAHPSTARFVCTKLANHYVGVPPPSGLVDDLASVFARTGGDMKAVLLALSEHPKFWEAARAKRLSHPTDYAFRLARAAGWMAPHEIGDYLGSSGQGLFDRPTPDGYPELDSEAMDSNVLLQRWKLASRAEGALADAVPPGIRWSSESMTPEIRQTVVDLIAIRLTGRRLGEFSNTAALEMLEQSQPQLPARPDDYARDPQIRTVAAFISQLPEANVR